MPIKIKSQLKDYAVTAAADFDFLLPFVNDPFSFFIVDKKVYELYKNTNIGLIKRENLALLDVNENMKNLDTVCALYEEAVKLKAKKNLTVVSVGGGIIQDITGFFADSIYRGVKWVFVPTTLLAQADSCIGSKTSLNFKQFKNLIGTFFSPDEIYLNTAFVKTLGEVDYYSGVGEIAKLCMMDSFESANYFKNNLAKIAARDEAFLGEILEKALLVKKKYIEEDEFDRGIRNMLNYGHCFGHALESAGDFKVTHGQAVVAGMILSNIVALKRGLLSSEKEQFYLKEILLPILKTKKEDLAVDLDKLLSAMSKDKKNTGTGMSLVMINDSGEMLIERNLTREEAGYAVNKFEDCLKNMPSS